LSTVVGVGSLSAMLDEVAPFSSRGMTKRALLDGIGVPKPDVLLPGEGILGLSLDPTVCEIKQGTSFSVPIMTGGVALALSSLEIKYGRQ
jgi:membrane-bound transcription factor site-1 protease